MELQVHFQMIPDFRVQGRCDHLLSDVLLLVLCGVLADCNDYEEIADYGRDNEDFLRAELGLALPNGIPSSHTLWRVMRYLDATYLEKSFRSCYAELLTDLPEKHFRIDGKALRGTIPSGGKQATIQMVSLWLDEEKLCFGQEPVTEKSNEIEAIPRLLDQLDCQDSLITIDAIACQQRIVEKIISKQADYLIALKKNQGSLYEQVSEWLNKHKAGLPSFEQWDKEHGRIEHRKVWVCNHLNLLEATHSWQGLRSIALIETRRDDGNKQTVQQRYYISSLVTDAEKYLLAARGHWGIENGLHWQLDISFREDNSQVKADQGAINLHTIRKQALQLLARHPDKMSVKRKRKKIARNNEFLTEVLKPLFLVK